jgi:FMN phosphatase YigB (HAD superfamily)
MDLLGIGTCFQHPTIDVRAVEFFTKHNPECYGKAMAIAGVTDPSTCMLLDDSTSNMKAAKAAGWQTVLVGKTSRDDGSVLECPEADYIIDTILEVEALLPHLFATAADATPGSSDSATVNPGVATPEQMYVAACLTH